MRVSGDVQAAERSAFWWRLDEAHAWDGYEDIEEVARAVVIPLPHDDQRPARLMRHDPVGEHSSQSVAKPLNRDDDHW